MIPYTYDPQQAINISIQDNREIPLVPFNINQLLVNQNDFNLFEKYQSTLSPLDQKKEIITETDNGGFKINFNKLKLDGGSQVSQKY